MMMASKCISRLAPSVKCKSVRKEHTMLPDTLGDLTSATKYF
jgi:hypothetical protein